MRVPANQPTNLSTGSGTSNRKHVSGDCPLFRWSSPPRRLWSFRLRWAKLIPVSVVACHGCACVQYWQVAALLLTLHTSQPPRAPVNRAFTATSTRPVDSSTKFRSVTNLHKKQSIQASNSFSKAIFHPTQFFSFFLPKDGLGFHNLFFFAFSFWYGFVFNLFWW